MAHGIRRRITNIEVAGIATVVLSVAVLALVLWSVGWTRAARDEEITGDGMKARVRLAPRALTLRRTDLFAWTQSARCTEPPVTSNRNWWEHTGSSYELTGSINSNPPGGIFDKNSFRCVGANSSLGGKTTGMTVCEAIDADGDKRLTYYSLAADGKVTREAVTGTGKYDGMVVSGSKYEPVGPFPTIKAGTSQSCNHQTGTYKLK